MSVVTYGHSPSIIIVHQVVRVSQFKSGTYHVHMVLLCTSRIPKSIKFIKNSEKSHIFFESYFRYIKLQIQIHYSLAIIKKEISDKFIILDLSEILSFLLLLHSYN
jgi:plasmid rolling circle replication initiator protein Rep